MTALLVLFDDRVVVAYTRLYIISVSSVNCVDNASDRLTCMLCTPRTVVASLTRCSLRGSPGAHGLGRSAQLCSVWPRRTWNRLQTALRSPELSLTSFKRQLKTHSSVPAPDSAGCRCGCRLPSSHRRCCDCTASSAPTTNVPTRLDQACTQQRSTAGSRATTVRTQAGPFIFGIGH